MIDELLLAKFNKKLHKKLLERLPDNTFLDISITLKNIKSFCEIHRQDDAIPCFWKELYPLDERIHSGVKLSKDDASLMYWELDSLQQTVWKCILVNRKLRLLSQKYFGAIIEESKYASMLWGYESNPKRGRANPFLLLLVIACTKSNKRSAATFEFEILKDRCKRITILLTRYFSNISVQTSVNIKTEATGTFEYFTGSETISLVLKS